jgi:hypothetical protein
LQRGDLDPQPARLAPAFLGGTAASVRFAERCQKTGALLGGDLLVFDEPQDLEPFFA